MDHASSDNSRDVLLSFKSVLNLTLMLYDSNNSFAYSNNVAARQSTSDFLLFLNNDIIFQSDPIPQLVKHLDDSSVGLVGIKLLYPVYDSSLPSLFLRFASRCAGMLFPKIRLTGRPGHSEKIQHAGISFFEDIILSFYRPCNLDEKSISGIPLDVAGVFPAVTAAAMLCRREEFLDVGGFCEDYLYGYEDVDLCLTYLSKLKKVSLSANELSLIHDEGSTQKLDLSDDVRERRLNNQAVLQRRYGYAIKRAFRKDQVKTGRFWSGAPLTAAFAVTEAHKNAKAGDYFTAMELASACAEKLGWEVRFLASNQNWYDLDGIDVLVVMVDAYDLAKMRHAKPGLVKVAWMRNWFDRWAVRPCFDDYDIYLCSSKTGGEFIERCGKEAHIFPIAANEKRFKPGDKQTLYNSDYCFTGHKWGVIRDIEAMLDPSQLEYEFAVYGNGWGGHDRFGRNWKGFVQYNELPAVYAATRVVIDDAVNDITKPWGSVNSRVFDALASGALVITNDVKGSNEIFGGKLPAYKTPEELQSLLELYLGNENTRLALVADLRKTVLENHTYNHRTCQLQSILTGYFDRKFRIAIKVPVPKKKEANEWGDYHFALALKRAFVKLGHSVRIDLLPDWDTPLGLGDDVAIVLRGLSSYKPRPGHINLMWNISHPDKIGHEEYDLYDHIFVASRQYADRLRESIDTPVTALLQCTDTNIFYPEMVDEVPEYDVLFVGNSRKQYRRIVKDAIESGLPVNIYGTLWEKIVPGEYIKGTYIKNSELRLYYSKCGVLLNDHWPSMGDNGFISNRLFDAGACGACVVSDDAAGIS